MPEPTPEPDSTGGENQKKRKKKYNDQYFDGKNKTFKIIVNLPAGCMMLSFNTMSP
jgi:hypothetical protein